MGTGVKHSARGKNSFKVPEGRALWILFIPSFLHSFRFSLSLILQNLSLSLQLSMRLSHIHTESRVELFSGTLIG